MEYRDIEDCRGRLTRVAFRLVGEDAEDVVQDAFLRAWLARDSFKADSRLYTWLYRIVINTAKNHLVKARRSRTVPMPEGEDFRGDDCPESETMSTEFVARYLKGLEGIEPGLREILVKRELEGKKYDQIAADLGVPVGTVRSRLHRGRKQMQATTKVV